MRITPAALYKWFAFIIFALYANLACAPSKKLSSPPPTAQDIWRGFLCKTVQGPKALSLHGNLYLYQKTGGQRLRFSLWGNANYPFRMSLRTTFGSTVAQILLQRNRGEVYLPRQKTRYLFDLAKGHLSSFQGLTTQDIQIIVSILAQDWSHLKLHTLQKTMTGSLDRLCFTDSSRTNKCSGDKHITDNLSSTAPRKTHSSRTEKKILLRKICLNHLSQPVFLQGDYPVSWTGTIAYNPKTRLPCQIIFSSRQKKMVFKIKKYLVLTKGFSNGQLQLKVPPGTINSSL